LGIFILKQIEMGYIPSADTVYAVAYLTEIGRNYLFNKNNNRFDAAGDDLFEIKKFALSDGDTNYQTIELLESGQVPDVTGKNDGCLKTMANYVQSNLIAYIFDSTPTNIEYSTDLPSGTPPTLVINETDINDISAGETPVPPPIVSVGGTFTSSTTLTTG
jgi:hypothetical protein